MLRLALLLLAPLAPPATRPPEAVVITEARSITLPALPEDGAQGRAGFAATHARILEAQKDLEAALAALYALPEASVSLRGLTVPDASLEEGRGLVAVWRDPEHLRLQTAFLDTWKGWQAALVEGHLASAKALPAAAASPRYQAAHDLAAQVIRASTRNAPQAANRLDASFNEENASLYTDLGNRVTPEQRAVLDHVDQGAVRARQTLEVANKLIPNVAEPWNAFVAHLNAQAVRLLELEPAARAAPGGPLGALRVQARIAYLERFRAALWYCDLVWAQVASAPVPAAPRALRP